MNWPRSALEAIEQARKAGLVTEGVGVHLPAEATVKMAPMPADISEDDFSDRVVSYAQDHRWRVLHIRPARTSKGWRTPVSGDGNGFPDLVLVRERVLFAELKSAKGVMSQDQKDWLFALMNANAPYFLWRPSDWSDIERILA